jgi:uncharacterized protein with HEPN domain
MARRPNASQRACAQHPHMQWRAMAGMRDRLIPGYFDVDLDLVWDVLQTKIPELRRHMQAILGAS